MPPVSRSGDLILPAMLANVWCSAVFGLPEQAVGLQGVYACGSKNTAERIGHEARKQGYRFRTFKRQLRVDHLVAVVHVVVVKAKEVACAEADDSQSGD